MDPPTSKSLSKINNELFLRDGSGRYLIALAKHHRDAVKATLSTQHDPAATLAVTFSLEYGDRLWPAEHVTHRVNQDVTRMMVYRTQHQESEGDEYR